MIVKEKITPDMLTEPFVKGACDIVREIVAIDAPFHIDCAEELIADGSEWKNIWGFNVYPDRHIECTSMINIRPKQNNRSMDIKIPEILNAIEKAVKKYL